MRPEGYAAIARADLMDPSVVPANTNARHSCPHVLGASATQEESQLDISLRGFLWKIGSKIGW